MKSILVAFNLPLAFLAATVSCAHSVSSSNPLLEARISPPHKLDMPQGALVYEDSGQAAGDRPTLVCIPGMGDTRGQFRFLAPLLHAEGYRVVVLDPRGQGASQGDWDTYTADAIGDDVVQLLGALPGPIVLIGNSAGGAAAAWAAAHAADRVRGIVLLGAFLRDSPMGAIKGAAMRLFLRAAVIGPWGAPFWGSYYRSLYIDHPPPDLDPYIDALKANLSEGERIPALRAMLLASKSPVTAILKDVRAPTLVVQGERDPDFNDPAAEADWILSQLHGTKLMVPGTGHYPHVEVPQDMVHAIKDFIDAQVH